MYPDTLLLIDGQWTSGSSGNDQSVLNPANGEVIGKVAHADRRDLDRALEAADRGYRKWKVTSPMQRSAALRKAAELLRTRVEEISLTLTLEQGKPLSEARIETLHSADVMDWFAEEARRTYGRIIPARSEGVMQLVVKEPVGPVAAFTPWNFPLNQVVRKCSAAIAAGCSIIVKGPEETPASCAALIRALLDGGVPKDVVQLVFGVPAEISEYLIPHPVIRKITFTGSTPVGKQLAALAGQHMKRITMELGGHAPAIVFADADIDAAASLLAAAKFRNAGQVCISPTRFLVQDTVFDQFVERFTAATDSIAVGDGRLATTQMGPLANERRLQAMEMFVSDAVQKGAKVRTGGTRVGNRGNFFKPTVLVDVNHEMRIMHEEPFGPLAPIMPFQDFDAVVKEANRLPFGLAAYAYTRSSKIATAIGSAFESGMVSINHHGLGLPEVPFGGVKDSGYGSEGGSEAIDAYLNTKFISQLGH
ncbi:NAD-dependent succinate-semialdehyde dehydrogenase [Bradyrhizobium sp. KB893862 SZCCT0404]|uniref:NAD-dependent succinate-semialdehyde dehydrogenase n=1 Tax=Bradyrhizobium sp. KB893862 SZCCT0404 TaxID=2807672 RepID=UPI001BAD85C4|nr:NAD-dependent succinate-semialdehyde dehydrogenase [Bradyrhizobium sp. KB893862 SZCCT0404]MBR1177151.1 NAD-dependent succinate-semialdehyde dehydrogenase [Bradyrhizobium sp. KB893862 SZCCT0404]